MASLEPAHPPTCCLSGAPPLQVTAPDTRACVHAESVSAATLQRLAGCVPGWSRGMISPASSPGSRSHAHFLDSLRASCDN